MKEFKLRKFQQEILKSKDLQGLHMWPRRMSHRALPYRAKSIEKFPDGSGSKIVYYEEISEWPDYKWYKNPIKWYNWQKVMKLLDKQTKT